MKFMMDKIDMKYVFPINFDWNKCCENENIIEIIKVIFLDDRIQKTTLIYNKAICGLCKNGKEDCVEFMLNNVDFNISKVEPLILSCLYRGNIKLLKLMMDKGNIKKVIYIILKYQLILLREFYIMDMIVC